MKLIMAIVSNDDSAMVQKELTKSGFAATKLATTGGFLSHGNTTYIIGADDTDVDKVMDIFSRFSKKRNATVSMPMEYSALNTGMLAEVNVGGATVFVLNVERFEKL